MDGAAIQACDPRPRFGEPIGSWHRWFAWRPVKTYDQRRAWFRFVARRCIQKHEWLYGGSDFWWQYSLDREHDMGYAPK
jgi:hypothetical protein